MKRGHLTKRQPRGRRTAWARALDMRGGELFGVTYRVFARLSTTGAVLVEGHSFTLAELASARWSPRTLIAIQLLGIRAQVRWRRDKLDLENLGVVDTTPPPKYGEAMFLAATDVLNTILDGFDPRRCTCTFVIVSGRDGRRLAEPPSRCNYCRLMLAREDA